MKVTHAENNFIITKLPSQLALCLPPDRTTHAGGGPYPGHPAKFLAGPMDSLKEIRLKMENQQAEAAFLVPSLV